MRTEARESRDHPGGVAAATAIGIERWTAEIELPGVGPLLVRAVTRDDLELERRFIQALSPETIRLRVMGTIGQVTDAQLERLVTFDPAREVVLAAILRQGAGLVLPAAAAASEPDEDEIVAVGRLAPTPDEAGVVEFAITVHDRYHGLGLGRAMMSRLLDAARRLGYETLRGQTMPGNRRMLRLAARLGFTTMSDPDDPMVVRMERPTQALRLRTRRSRLQIALADH
jgi:acetyltransferase